MRRSVSARRCWSTAQSSSTSADPFQPAAAVRDNPGRVGEGGEQVPGDPQRGSLAAPADDLAAHRSFEPGPAQPAGAARSPASRSTITVIAAAHVSDRNGCAAVSIAAGHTHSSRSRICWICATLAVISCSRRAPRWRSRPQSPRPVRGRSSAAARSAGRSGPRPCRRSCRRSDPRYVPGPGGLHRLHTHERHRPVRGELAQHPPPVPGRLTRDRHPGEALAAARSAAQSSADPRSQALHRNVRRASTFESWSVTTTICFCRPGRSPRSRYQPAPAPAAGNQPCVAVPVTTRDTTTVDHERPPACDGTPSPTSASGGRSYASDRRRTCFYAAGRSAWLGCCAN